MKATAKVLCGVLLAGAFAAEATAQTTPSSPRKALDAYIQLQCKGGTLREWQKIVSKESFALVSGLEQATSGRQLNLTEKVPPEDAKYASLLIVKESNTMDRAILQGKVKYRDSWLKQEVAEAKETGMTVDVVADEQTKIELISDASPGEDAEYPYHVKGDGYVSFLFVKQAGTWRFHKSHASKHPSDFTPLLASKDLSGGLTVTVKPSTEPSSPLPNTAPNQALAGRHSGKDWRGLFVYEKTFSNDKDHYRVQVVEKEEPEEFKRLGGPMLSVKIPKVPGEYKLSPTFNVTFFEPPGNNRIATEGILKVTRDGAAYMVELIARYDKDNDVRGRFTYKPLTGN